MIGITITFTSTAVHNLWDILTGADTTGVTVSKTYPGWKTGETGSFHDINLIAADANAGSIIIGDGSIQLTDPGMLNGQSKFFPGKTSLVGLYARATSANDVLRIEMAGGGIG